MDVYVVEAAGDLPRRYTPWPSDDASAAWSRDGRFLYFSSNRSGTYEVWKVPASGGDLVRVTRNGGTQAFESARGDYLYFGKQIPAGGPPGIWRVPLGGGDEELVRGEIGYGDWTLLEDGICYLNRATKPWPTFEKLAFETGEVERVASLEHQPLAFWPSVSPDGRWLLYSVDEGRESDIMLVDNFR
jgi:Tol biopolymer transport system component